MWTDGLQYLLLVESRVTPLVVPILPLAHVTNVTTRATTNSHFVPHGYSLQDVPSSTTAQQENGYTDRSERSCGPCGPCQA